MDKIFNQAKDKNVSAVIIYGKENDLDVAPLAYVDEACTIAMKTSELKDAFLKRAVIKIGEAYFIPSTMAFKGSENICSLGYSFAGEGASVVFKSISSVADV